jgi:hypothetical protein
MRVRKNLQLSKAAAYDLINIKDDDVYQFSFNDGNGK